MSSVLLQGYKLLDAQTDARMSDAGRTDEQMDGWTSFLYPPTTSVIALLLARIYYIFKSPLIKIIYL